MNNSIGKIKLIKRLEKFEFLFFWLRLFYPKAKGFSWVYLLSVFVQQKLFLKNGMVPWPVHFTSRVLYYKNITVGNMCAPGLSGGNYIQGRGGIILGHNVRLGPNTGLISSNHNLADYDVWDKTRPLRIGDNVWVGMNCVIMPGVEIGSNVVIAANSVVTKDIPANSIAAGAPCKVIKKKESYCGFDYSTL